jgi:hypothetical protein
VEQGRSIYRPSALSRYVSGLLTPPRPQHQFFLPVGWRATISTPSTAYPPHAHPERRFAFMNPFFLILQQSFLSQRSFLRPLSPYHLLPPARGQWCSLLICSLSSHLAHFPSFSLPNFLYHLGRSLTFYLFRTVTPILS